MTVADDYQALREGAGAVWLPRDAVEVRGPEATGFLQGQLSQDVEAIVVGGSAESLLLQPDGKVEAYLRVTRVDDDAFVLDVDGGWQDTVVQRLNRFKLRTKADIVPLEWRCLALRGPELSARIHEDGDHADPRGSVMAAVEWPGLVGYDLLGPAPTVPAGVVECGLEAYEALRIEAGIPLMGRELTAKTIPAEAGIVERTVSFTKGCFTGQELVARIDSRGGNVPRRLRAVVVDGDPPPAGAPLRTADGAEAGAITSAAWSPRCGTVALAYVVRRVDPPVDAVVAVDGAERPARIELLPLA